MYDYSIRIILIGDCAVGKTAFSKKLMIGWACLIMLVPTWSKTPLLVHKTIKLELGLDNSSTTSGFFGKFPRP